MVAMQLTLSVSVPTCANDGSAQSIDSAALPVDPLSAPQ